MYYPAPITCGLTNQVGADYAVLKMKMDFEIGPSIVTLSEAKGLSRSASRCFTALSMTRL